MRLRHLARLDALPAEVWDRCFPPDYPFTRHAFLAALERHGCATPATGWTPCHAVLEDAAGQVRAAAPLYLKTHSYGEFVFDFAWAEASRRLRSRYYPKLLCAVPFTPAAGPRLGAIDPGARRDLAQSLAQEPQRLGVSSLHALFLDDQDFAACRAAGGLERSDLQFHWHNRGYADFAAFLAQLSADKRKKILRERRRVAEAGLRFELRAGDELSEGQWRTVYALYANTYDERGQAPYLTLEFFLDYGQKAGTPVRLILGYEGHEIVAVAITLIGGDTLYGRHWGARAHYHSLHFETCYYQGIEYCIRHGLARYDAGAQGGQHKLPRGFLPVRTRSTHWLTDARLRAAVAAALVQERAWLDEQALALADHHPYKRDAAQMRCEEP
jgi:predicted N-acyltransferase